MTIYTIGFTRSSAESFFTRLQRAGVRRLIDVRLNNISQLAGFAKKDDLAFFLRTICGIPYEHHPELAPTQELLDFYRKDGGAWSDYERRFTDLIAGRSIETALSREALDGACLLCSEDKPTHCHRRLVAEYLRERWGGVEIVHL
jgi:uncharacterized protein (DUF488 family)